MNKRAYMFPVLIALGFLVAMLTVLTTVKSGQDEFNLVLGVKQFDLLETVQEEETLRLYTDILFKQKAQDAVIDVAFDGGGKTTCGGTADVTVWINKDKFCLPTMFSVAKEIERQVQKEVSEEQLQYTEKIPYEVFAGNDNDKLKVIGFATRPVEIPVYCRFGGNIPLAEQTVTDQLISTTNVILSGKIFQQSGICGSYVTRLNTKTFVDHDLSIYLDLAEQAQNIVVTCKKDPDPVSCVNKLGKDMDVVVSEGDGVIQAKFFATQPQLTNFKKPVIRFMIIFKPD
jgi:hypothetical protein